MNTQKLSFRVATLAFFVAGASLTFFSGCSGDDSSSTPSDRDSGNEPDSTSMHKEGGSTKPDSGKGGKDATGDDVTGDDVTGDDVTGDDVTSSDDATGDDSSSSDAGTCESDSSTCNTCYTDAEAAKDPYNACSSFTKNCVPFAASRVPAGAVGKL